MAPAGIMAGVAAGCPATWIAWQCGQRMRWPSAVSGKAYTFWHCEQVDVTGTVRILHRSDSMVARQFAALLLSDPGEDKGRPRSHVGTGAEAPLDHGLGRGAPHGACLLHHRG